MSSPPIAPWNPEDLISTDSRMLDEIIRQAEARLQAQLQSAIASDARAMVLASIEGAASAALFVAGATTELSDPAKVAALMAAFPLLAGAVSAAWSARPVEFGWVGSAPQDWAETAKANYDYDKARAHHAAHLNDYLCANDRFLSSNARWTRVALAVLGIAPLLAFGGFLFSL